MKKRRMLALLLALCMALGVLAGCNGQKDTDTPGSSSGEDAQTPSAAQTSDAAKQTSAKYVYKTQFVPMELPVGEGREVQYINIRCAIGNYLYLTAEVGIAAPEGGGDTVSGTETPAEPEEGVTEDGGSIDDEMGVMPLDESGEETPDESSDSEDAVEDEIADDEIADEEIIGTEYYNYETRLYRYDLLTCEAEEIPGYTPLEIPEGWNEGWTNINQLMAGSNGSVWIADSASCYKIVDEPDGEEIGGIYYAYGDYVSGPTTARIQQFSVEGEVLQERTTVTDPYSAESDISSKNLNLIDRNDRFYYYDWNTNEITVEDFDGNVLKTFEEENGYLSTFCDEPAIERYDTETYESVLYRIDPETLEIGEKIERPLNSWSFSVSYDEAYDYYYQYNSNVYGYKQQEQISELIVSWMDCDVNPDSIYSVYPLEDGRVVGVMNEWDDKTYQTNYTLVFLTKTDASEVKPKTVFTLACMYMDYQLQDAIIEFNRSSEEYRIIVNDYSQYATQDDYEAGLTKLGTEIMSGKVPDLLYTYNIPISKYAAQGILVDLKPYIDADPELNGDQLMAHVLDVASEDGKLYEAFSSFRISAPVALEKVVGEYEQWTLAEMKDALTKLQPDARVFDRYTTRGEMLTQLLQNNFSAYVNWSTGECSFDSQDFRDLLEFVDSFPEEYNYEDETADTKYGASAVLAGEQLMEMNTLTSMSDYAWTLSNYYGKSDFVYIGYPSASGNNTSFVLGDGLSIGANCADIDGAWQFVRRFLTEEYQEENVYQFPTNKAAFDKQVEEMTTVEYLTDINGEYLLDENGEKIVSPKAYIWESETYEQIGTIDALTQEDIDKIMALYERTNSVSGSDSEILEIIEEVAAGYFGGQTSLDEAARVIQNRVSLFVKERM